MEGPCERLRLTDMFRLILAFTLLGSPATLAPPHEPDFAKRLESADITISDSDVLITAFDHVGRPIGTIAMWTDERGAIHLESDYDDGYAATIVLNGVQIEATLPPEIIAERAQLIVDLLDEPGSGPVEGWAACAGRTALAVGACTAASWSVILCGASSFLAACECIPLVVPDDIPYEEC